MGHHVGNWTVLCFHVKDIPFCFTACKGTTAVLNDWQGTIEVIGAEYKNYMNCRWLIPVNTSKVGD